MALPGSKGNGKSTSIQVTEQVKELVTAKVVNDKFTEILSNQEAFKKASAMVQLYEAIGKQRIEVLKIKPSGKFYNSEKELVREEFTHQEIEALKKAEERLHKMENAFTKAFEKGEYKDVFELVQQLGSKDKGGSSKEGSGETS